MNFVRKLLLLLLISPSISLAQSRIVAASPTLQDRYPKKSGVFRMNAGNVSLGIVKKDTVAVDTLRLYNTDDKPHAVRVVGGSSNCLSVIAGRDTVPPATEVWFVVRYDASCNPTYGFVMDRFSIATDDALQPIKPFTVTLKLEERFPVLGAADSMLIPKVRVPVNFIDLGVVRQGVVVKKELMIYNDGKGALLVRQVRSDSPSLKVRLPSDSVAPDSSVMVTFELNTAGRAGKEGRTFQIYVNDPAKPELRFDVSYTIE